MERGLTAEEVYRIAIPDLEFIKPTPDLPKPSEISEAARKEEIELLRLKADIPKKERRVKRMQDQIMVENKQLENYQIKLRDILLDIGYFTGADVHNFSITDEADGRRLFDNLRNMVIAQEDFDKITEVMMDIMQKIYEIKQFMEEVEKEKDKIELEFRDLPEIKARVKQVEKKKTPSELIRESNMMLARFMKKPCLVIKFEDIADYKSLHKLMTDDNRYPENKVLLIIYRSQPTYGHWVGLFYNDYGINYFNSYGSYIDKSIDHIPEEFKQISNQTYPYLLKLLSESRKDVFYNHIQLQKDKVGDIVPQTCGRFVGWMFYNTLLNPKDRMEKIAKNLVDLAKKLKITPDELIVKLTDKQVNADVSKRVIWL